MMVDGDKRWLDDRLNRIDRDLQELKDGQKELYRHLSEYYVSKVEYAPVRALAWGLVVFIVGGVLTALIKGVLH